ncbi:hypothetical protein [Halosimplex amylolyticum]|uniref:hypothetical protein n=1 Tax=Halosimplex amylolyticum TaxID=3396616 RepID=UPI003F560876
MAPPIPLIILYTRNSTAVEGATRFQKLVFLAQEETRIPPRYTYEPDKFGPYSWELESDLERAIESGFIERNVEFNSVGNPKYKYSLTPDGIREAKSLLPSYEPLFSELEKIKSRYNNWNLEKLLRYVYRKYPNYLDNTDLDVDRLFDPEASSQFYETDEEFVGEFRYLETLSRVAGEITRSGESFERIAISTLQETELQVEKFENGRISVYWETDTKITDFIDCLESDSSIVSESSLEFTLGNRWMRGKFGEIAPRLYDRRDCSFLAVASEDHEYEVTWERDITGVEGVNEITALFMPEDELTSTTIRSVLSTYLAQEYKSNEAGRTIDPGTITSDDVRQSVWETAKFILG